MTNASFELGREWENEIQIYFSMLPWYWFWNLRQILIISRNFFFAIMFSNSQWILIYILAGDFINPKCSSSKNNSFRKRLVNKIKFHFDYFLFKFLRNRRWYSSFLIETVGQRASTDRLTSTTVSPFLFRNLFSLWVLFCLLVFLRVFNISSGEQGTVLMLA